LLPLAGKGSSLLSIPIPELPESKPFLKLDRVQKTGADPQLLLAREAHHSLTSEVQKVLRLTAAYQHRRHSTQAGWVLISAFQAVGTDTLRPQVWKIPDHTADLGFYGSS
jgi:hypothetical protein